MILGLLLFVLHSVTVGLCEGLSCCQNITSSQECKNACLQLSTRVSKAEQLSRLAMAGNHCPDDLVEFWECSWKSLPVLQEMERWPGRPCCELSHSSSCQNACLQATSERDLQNHCSRGTEDILYSCLARQKNGDECCTKAGQNHNCRATCWNMYLSNSLTLSHSKQQLKQHCRRQRHVIQCMQKQTRATREPNHFQSLHCCEKTRNDTCRDKCHQALQGEEKEEEIINLLIEACGYVSPLNPLYQCFLGQNVESYVAGIDAAKLHCCQKASSNRCSSLCAKTYSRKWDSIGVFEANCGYLSPPISTMETEMHSCLKEVEEPCQLGCSGLQYCTNMNRPTEHFRSCNARSDHTAMEDVQLWQRGVISLPSMNIPVKDIRECEPQMWKAIACALQIKPCYKRPIPPQICMEDCVYILTRCVDHSRLTKGQMVKDMCNRLPKTEEGSCISVRLYTEESSHKGRESEISHPCEPNPCKDGDICHIHRRKCKHPNNCHKYVCTKGCKLGEVSKVLVPKNTHVIIPEYHDLDNVGDCQKYKVCQCSHTGVIRNNCATIPCVRKQNCINRPGNVTAHGEHFNSGCNDCVCFSGDTLCSRRHCSTDTVVSKISWSGIQDCNCRAKYNPVCGTNGKTYPSNCVARCAGQNAFMPGSCHQMDPCSSNPCPVGYQCVENRKVCFGHGDMTCRQYQCESEMLECNTHIHDPVCDTHNEEFSNPCVLLAANKTLAYRGHCSTADKCDNSGPVCGHNGETYKDVCTAYGDRSTVDYYGPCKLFGKGPGDDASCNVVCFPVSPKNCEGIYLPGTCCPVCAAQLRVLSNEKLALAVSKAVNKEPISVRTIMSTLSNMVTVAECDVFGYLGVEGDIVVLLKAVTKSPTSLQVQACMKEAERLEYLIGTQSPSISSNMVLSPLLYASLTVPTMQFSAASPHPLSTAVTLYISLICLLLQVILRTRT